MNLTAGRIGPADKGRRMTLDEFGSAEVEEGYRFELARGCLEVVDVPDGSHSRLACFLYTVLADYRHRHPRRIHRFGGAGAYRLRLPGLISSRIPDIAVVLEDAPKDCRNHRVPFLAMEVVSASREARERDYVAKREEHLAYGLFEYWIVDPIDRRITVLVRDGDTWIERVFNADQSAEGLVLPGFAVRLPDLWAAAEEAEG